MSSGTEQIQHVFLWLVFWNTKHIKTDKTNLQPIKRAKDGKTYLELTTNHLEFIDIVCQLNYAQYTSRIQCNEAEKYVACHQS